MRVAVTGCTSDFGTAILPALLQRHEVAEAALEPSTRVVSRWCDDLPDLRALTGGSGQFAEALTRVEHAFLDAGDATVHVEVHRGRRASWGSALVKPGPGAHARLYTPVAAALAERGIDVVIVDLPGHGLSTGRRGDAPPSLARRAVDAARRYAEQRLAAPVYVAHQDCDAGRQTRRPPPLALLARVAPRAPVPVLPLLRRLEVELPDYATELLDGRADPLACRTLTARTAAACAQVEPESLARDMAFASALPHPPLSVVDVPDDPEFLIMAAIA